MVMRSFDIFFDVSLNKLLNKSPSEQWFATPSRSRDNTVMDYAICVAIWGRLWKLPVQIECVAYISIFDT